MMKGFISILILGLWLSPSPSTALPDLFAPFRSMFGIKGSNGGPPPPHSHSTKHLSSPKDPSSNNVQSHFGPHGSSSSGDDPFKSNFGFGSPPGPQEDHPSSLGGDGHFLHGPPKDSRGPPPRGSRGPPRDHSHGPGDSHHGPPREHSPQRGSSFSHRPSSRPSSASPSTSGSSRPVRQQPVSSYRPRPSYGGHASHPLGPPSHGGGGGGGGPVEDDAMDLSGYKPGPPPPGFEGGSSSPQNEDSSYHRDPPQFLNSLPSFSNGGGRGNAPFQGGESPYPGGPSDGSQYPSDGPEGQRGEGFNGFGSFPSNNPSEDEDSPPPPQRGSGGYRSRQKPFRASRPGPEYNDAPPSSSPTRYQPGGGGRGSGSPSGGPSYFGGPSDYPEQYQGGPRDTRQPEIITANDVNKYPAQIEDDEEQGGGPSGGFGPGGPSGGFSFGPSQSPSGRPSERPNGFGPHPSSSPGGPYGGSPAPAHFSGGRPYGGEDDESPGYQSSSPRHPSASTYSFNQPVSAGYQASAESIHYGKPMMMSASGIAFNKLNPKVKPNTNNPRPQDGRFSAQIKQQKSTPKIFPLKSPKDPNYRGMSPSSLKPVSAPYEPDTAASGGHGGGAGGFEGLSNNGDRILYHVAGHQGPYSYRFGYDTGKGYNRLFRFEEKDGKGMVKGKYGFYDKHGKLNVINYEAHPKHGFHAERGHSHGHY